LSGTVPLNYINVGNGRLTALSIDHNRLTGTGNVNKILKLNECKCVIYYWFGWVPSSSCIVIVIVIVVMVVSPLFLHLSFLLYSITVPYGGSDRVIYDTLVQYTLHENLFTSLETEICNNNLMVEFKADCNNVCLCYGRFWNFCNRWCGYINDDDFDGNTNFNNNQNQNWQQQQNQNNWQQQQQNQNNWQQQQQQNQNQNNWQQQQQQQQQQPNRNPNNNWSF
jgi:hypothetical protein